MQDLWTIDDPEEVDIRFRSLMRDIRRSDPLAILAAAQGADGGSTVATIWPNVAWTSGQRRDLAEAIWSQLPILAVRARFGDTMAHLALELVQDTDLIKEYYPAAYETVSPMIGGMKDPLEVRIGILFAAAMTGDDAATKAALDLCLHGSDLGADDPNIVEYLPAGISFADLQELIGRYRQQARAQDLPPLVLKAFDND